MNLEIELLKAHSKPQATRIQRYVGDDPDRFAQLIAVFLKGQYQITQRAAWPISLCVEQHPDLVKPHLKVLVKNLSTPGIHDAVKRNTMRLLQFVTIPKSLQGLAAEYCFRYLQDSTEPIAVRVFAMTVLASIAMEQPELKKELKLILEDQLPYGSAGFVSRARKTLKQLTR